MSLTFKPMHVKTACIVIMISMHAPAAFSKYYPCPAGRDVKCSNYNPNQGFVYCTAPDDWRRSLSGAQAKTLNNQTQFTFKGAKIVKDRNDEFPACSYTYVSNNTSYEIDLINSAVRDKSCVITPRKPDGWTCDETNN